ncbi:glutamyl-tRNA(Gln) amidotransferase subunit C, mitochondrial-like [Stegodyphus dumicola]|uniref:glutamyl-tRNA(Gln) amidotransferase subunit C, mitochondrial-like n=1 Tax=Stegodyphus dumicola TaxID=202533 RepID=UPI0015ACAEDD|nr:glutamyl-tRNA(Gln) amidotransferase subunit C, mitochondrial-like [Stegodyphus dumicola]
MIVTRKIFTSVNFKSSISQSVFRKFSVTVPFNAVNKDVVESLERHALVDFSTAAGIERLEKSIQFADRLMEVDTTGIEPLISTVYERNENLQADEVLQKSNREELMKAAPVTEEFYYVAPLGTFSRNPAKSSE